MSEIKELAKQIYLEMHRTRKGQFQSFTEAALACSFAEDFFLAWDEAEQVHKEKADDDRCKRWIGDSRCIHPNGNHGEMHIFEDDYGGCEEDEKRCCCLVMDAQCYKAISHPGECKPWIRDEE